MTSNEKVFPAYAGVNLWFDAGRRWLDSIPRVCGGEPRQERRRYRYCGYSPRMRG